MRVFTLALLSAQSAQVPVLTNNVTLDCGEDRPCQDSLKVFPVPKGQGKHMCIIAHLHPRGTSGSSTSANGAPPPTRASAPSYISYAAAIAAPISLSAPSVASPPLRCRCLRRDRCFCVSH